MRYVMNMEDLQGFADFIGIETKMKGKDMFFRFCPKCGSSAPKDDEWKFSVNWKTGAFGCLRSTCQYHGHFVELCRDYGYKLGIDVDKEYVSFPQPTERIKPRESAYAYLEGRGISREIADEYQVTAFENKPNILWFPFFNEYGKLVFAKFRKMDYHKGKDKSKEWMQTGGQPILFGMNVRTGYNTVVITEGQLDSMSVAEAFKGEQNRPDAFCSVPMGANGFTWIPHCIEWLKKFDTIIVFGDMEKGKMSLIDTIKQRIPGKIKSVRREDYLGEKDANDILRSFGADAVRKCIQNATESDVNCVRELADIEYIDITTLPKLKTGIFELDKALKGGICYGQVCLLTGKRGEGKSTFMSNIFAEAIDQGVGAFAYSGELMSFHFKQWLNSQLAGSQYMAVRKNDFDDDEYYLPEDIDKKISEWYRGKAFIYDKRSVSGDEVESMESLTETIRKIARMKNIKLFCVDNLMTAMDAASEQSSLYIAQSNFVKELKDIALDYNVVIILVAHPRKQSKEEKDMSFDNDFVSGSSNITDRVDIVMNYSRAKPDQPYDSLLQIGKNRLTGELYLGDKGIPMNYSAKTRRVTGLRVFDKRYGWEKPMIQVEDIYVPF